MVHAVVYAVMYYSLSGECGACYSLFSDVL